jgi:hypothetical protein
MAIKGQPGGYWVVEVIYILTVLCKWYVCHANEVLFYTIVFLYLLLGKKVANTPLLCCLLQKTNVNLNYFMIKNLILKSLLNKMSKQSKSSSLKLSQFKFCSLQLPRLIKFTWMYNPNLVNTSIHQSFIYYVLSKSTTLQIKTQLISIKFYFKTPKYLGLFYVC